MTAMNGIRGAKEETRSERSEGFAGCVTNSDLHSQWGKRITRFLPEQPFLEGNFEPGGYKATYEGVVDRGW